MFVFWIHAIIRKLNFDKSNVDNSNNLNLDNDEFEFPSRIPKIKGFSTSRNSKRKSYFIPKNIRLKGSNYQLPLALSERTYYKFSKFEENVKYI